jgi:hypothetical protein
MKLIVLVFLVTGSLGAQSFPDTGKVRVDIKTTALDFEASGPILGYARKIDGVVRTSPLIVNCTTLDTGIGLRNSHLFERISCDEKNSKSFDPKTQKNAIIVNNLKPAQGNVMVGDLFFNNKTEKVTIETKSHSDKFCGIIKLNLPKFGIEKISYKGIGVNDVIDVLACIPWK